MGRPKGSKNKAKPGEVSMQTELEEKSVKTVDEVLEHEDKANFKPQDEKILVEFYNIEEPGVPIKFAYGPTKKIEKFHLMHGGKYKLSREIIKHLETRQSPMYKYQPDGTGRQTKVLTGYRSRFQCRQVWE